MRFQLLAPGPRLAHTYGWDTVSAVRVADMNRAIREAGTSPASFQQPVEGCDGEVRGDFGPWQIASGGDGRLVHLALPLRGVKARHERRTWEGDAEATVEVQLRFLPHRLMRGDAESQRFELVLCTDAAPRAADGLAQPLALSRALPVANVVDLAIAGGSPEPDMTLHVLIKMALRDWLCANLGSFDHVFATVNLHRAASGDSFQWLKPTYATYVFLERPGEDDIFAILCRTGGRSADDLVEQLSPHAVPDGATAAFLVSPQRMLGDMLAPSLPAVLPGLKAGDVEFDEKSLRLRVDGEVQLDPFEHEGKTYHPVLEKLETKLREREIIMASTTSTQIVPGMESVCESTSFYHLGLLTKDDGTQTLGCREARKPVNREWTRKDTGMVILEWMLAIAGAIAGVATLWLGVGAGVLAAVLLVGTISLKVTEAVHNDDAPSIDLLVAQATDSITWANGSGFRLTSAELNGAFQLAGDFTGKVQRP